MRNRKRCPHPDVILCRDCLTDHLPNVVCPKTGAYPTDPGVPLKDVIKLWGLCQEFIKANHITCPETVYQCDWVSENSPEFIAEISKLVGYHKYDDEDGEPA